jgi:hypothetical protein
MSGGPFTDDELAELKAYIGEKKRWRTVTALIRDATYQHVARNPLSAAQQARVDVVLGRKPVERLAVLRGGSGGQVKEAAGG